MPNAFDRALADIASSQHGIFALADARKVGLSEAQIHRRATALWIPIHDEVYRVPGAVATWESELFAACLAAREPVGVSHQSAAALWDDLPGADRTILTVTCRRWLRTQRPGLVVHESTRFDAIDLTERHGIPVVTVERLVMELAGLHPFPNYVERVMQAARRKRFITYDSMLTTFNRLARRGVRGVKATRIALDRWNPRAEATQSDMETMLIQVLREHGLPEPVTQFKVLDEFGNVIASTDAALPNWKITIEYQSMQEHTDEFQLAADDRRRNEIIAAGYLPLAARVGDLRSGGHRLAEQIRAVIRRQAS